MVTLSKTESVLNMNANTALQDSEVTFTPVDVAVKTPSCGRTMADGSEIGCGWAVHSACTGKKPDKAKANIARCFDKNFMGFRFRLSNSSTSRA